MNNPSSPRALLVGWANSQDHWVRAIVREVLTTQQEPSQATLDEAYAICLSEKDLSDEPVTPVPSLALDEDPEDRIEALCLTSLKGVQGVNRLVGDQKIIFNPRMTVLFGENATGKSGYVRILKQIAAVRSVEKVLPDINAEPPPSQRAELEFTLDGKPDSATWQGEAGTRPFTRMSIFDTRAVSFHLDDELTYSYTPRDLALFQHVNFGVTAIADRLDEARKEAELGQNPFLSRFRSGSVVYPKIETLSAATDITTLETLANVSDAEAKLVDSYREKIEALNPQLITSRLELAKGNRDLLKSIVAVSATAAEFDPGAYEAALHRRSEASKHHRAATETAFSSYDIPTVLSEAWRHFIVAGRYCQMLWMSGVRRRHPEASLHP